MNFMKNDSWREHYKNEIDDKVSVSEINFEEPDIYSNLQNNYKLQNKEIPKEKLVFSKVFLPSCDKYLEKWKIPELFKGDWRYINSK